VGHTEDIYLTEFLSDSKTVLTSSYDNTAKLWDTYSGKLLHTFAGLLNTPEHVVNNGNTTLLSTDKRHLIALTTDGYLKKWTLPSGKMLFAIRMENNNGLSLQYSSDGKYILLIKGSLYNEINADVLDASNGRLIHQFRKKFTGHHINKFIGFSPGGKYILLQADSSLYLYAAPGKSLAYKLEQIENFKSAFFSPDGKYVIIFPKRSNRLRLWQTADGRLKEISISGTVVFSPDSKYILSKTKEDLYLINPENGVELHRFDEKINPYMSAHFSEEGKHIFLARPQGYIRGTDPYDSVTYIWETESRRLLHTFRGNGCDINDVVFSPDGKFAGTVCDYTSQLWDMATGEQIASLEGRAAIFSSDSKNFAVTGGRTVKIFNMRTGDVIAELKGYSNTLVNAVFSADGKLVITLSNEKSVKLWDITGGRIIKTFSEADVIKESCFSKNGKNLLLLTNEGKATVRDVSTGRPVFALTGNNINAAYYSPDGRVIVTAADSVFCTWDAFTGKKLFSIGELYSITDAGISANGTYGFYVFGGSAVGVVDFSTGRVIREYLGEENIIRCQFSPGSDFIFILGEKGTAKLLETATGKAQQFSKFSDVEYGSSYMGGYYYQNLWQGDFEHFSADGKWLMFRAYMDQYIVIKNLRDTTAADTLHTPNTLVKNAAFVYSGSKLVTGTADDKVRIWTKAPKGFRLEKEFPGNGFKLSPDGKWLLIVNNVQLRFYDLAAGRFRAHALAVNESDYFIQLADQLYYAASKEALNTLLFRLGNQYLSFEQFDIRLNRPDLVLKAMQNSDYRLILAYRKAYEKRIKKSGIDNNSFRDDYNIPEADFSGRDTIPFEQEDGKLNISIRATDTLQNIDRFNIWVNEVPMYGRNGLNLKKRNSKRFDTTIIIQLSSGKNYLQTSVTNRGGSESYRIPLYVNYKPEQKQKETLRFIGIGLDQFADSKNNLQYCVKDIRDLSNKLKEKYKDNIIIDTLFNENVTAEKVKALKEKLKQTSVNDKVIISYSGHGLMSKDYDYYLSTYSINFDKPEENGLPYEELENLLDSIPARKKLMLIDACHSGEVDKEEMTRITSAADSLLQIGTKGGVPTYTGKTTLGMKNSFELMQSLFVNVGKSTGATVISAAAGTQFALERGDLKNGVFTYSILEAMDKNPALKISELKKIVGERVEQLTNGLQKPTCRNETIAVDWNL
jgi:WD40 repeat protein